MSRSLKAPPPILPANRLERQAAYSQNMHHIRRQLKPGQRWLSKLLHLHWAEVVAEFLEETVYRPSFFIPASLTGIIGGIIWYGVALHFHYSVSGTEVLICALVGGAIGLISEYGRRFLHRRDKRTN